MAKRKNASVGGEERKQTDPDTSELFGRLDALYHAAIGGRLDRSTAALETIRALLSGYGMDAMEEAWAWWMSQPEYGREFADPLDYFSGDALEDITTAAFADSAKARLAARARG